MCVNGGQPEIIREELDSPPLSLERRSSCTPFRHNGAMPQWSVMMRQFFTGALAHCGPCRMFDGSNDGRVQPLGPGAPNGSRQRRLSMRWWVIHAWTVLRGSPGLRKAAKWTHASR